MCAQDFKLNCFGTGAQNAIFTFGTSYHVFSMQDDNDSIVDVSSYDIEKAIQRQTAGNPYSYMVPDQVRL